MTAPTGASRTNIRNCGLAARCCAGIAIPGFPQHAVAVKYATEHRCGVVVRGTGLCDAITGTDPLRDNLPLQVCTSAPCIAVARQLDPNRWDS